MRPICAIFEQQEPWTEPLLRLRFLYLDPRRSTGSSSLLKSSSSFSVNILALGGRSVALSYHPIGIENQRMKLVMRTNENFLERNSMKKPQQLLKPFEYANNEEIMRSNERINKYYKTIWMNLSSNNKV
jgi:hypothetical protein